MIFCTFAEDETMMYETVKSKFDKYFIPKRNVYERAVFNSRKQAEGETVDAFITALHTPSEHRQYGPLQDKMIRDRIVVGIMSNCQKSFKMTQS